MKYNFSQQDFWYKIIEAVTGYDKYNNLKYQWQHHEYISISTMNISFYHKQGCKYFTSSTVNISVQQHQYINSSTLNISTLIWISLQYYDYIISSYENISLAATWIYHQQYSDYISSYILNISEKILWIYQWLCHISII